MTDTDTDAENRFAPPCARAAGPSASETPSPVEASRRAGHIRRGLHHRIADTRRSAAAASTRAALAASRNARLRARP